MSRPRSPSVDSYFSEHAQAWKEIYEHHDVYSVVRQERLARALAFFASLELPPGARALDLGCGAGIASVALAERGCRVHAVDRVARMLELTRERVAEAAVSAPVVLLEADAQLLPYPTESFDVVLGLGLIGWVRSPEAAVAEMNRVLKAGGFLILSGGNPGRLQLRIDPLQNRSLAPARRAVKKLLGKTSSSNGLLRYLKRRELDQLLVAAGLRKLATTSYGFGPVRLFRKKILPERASVALHLRLQNLADRGSRVASLSSEYLVLAQKSAEA